jgi:excisionase family DNA binding protein
MGDRCDGGVMAPVTLGQAARLTGLGKTTITRAIKAGKLSATRREDGSYEIDPSELSRVYSVHPETPETVTQSGLAGHHATPSATPRETPETPDVTARLASLEAEVRGLKDLLAEVRQSRDEWKDQAGRLVLALPAPDQAKPEPPRRPWWRRLAG